MNDTAPSGADLGEAQPADPAAVPVAAARRRWSWRSVAGIVALVYAWWAAIDLLLLAQSGPRFSELHRTMGNVGVRVVLVGVLVALLAHGLDGVRVAVEDLVPATRRADPALRAAVRFLVPALAVPGALVLLWPVVRGWFA